MTEKTHFTRTDIRRTIWADDLYDVVITEESKTIRRIRAWLLGRTYLEYVELWYEGHSQVVSRSHTQQITECEWIAADLQLRGLAGCPEVVN